jgi:hypothetical protein
MAKVKIQAGMELDVLTKDELDGSLKAMGANWWSEIGRGDRYRRVLLTGVVTAAGAISVGGPSTPEAGPPPGYVWSVRRLCQSAVDETLDLFLNDDSPGSLVGRFPVARYWSFNPAELVLYPGDQLLATGASFTVASTVTVTGQVRELPLALAWRLGP